jgi:hypothetical protein
MPGAKERELYAQRAADVRRLAEITKDPEIRVTLEKMASSYDQLVQEADRIAHMRQTLGHAAIEIPRQEL